MKGNENRKTKEHSPDKSSVIRNDKSSIIIDGESGSVSDYKSDFSLSIAKNFEKPDDDILSKSSEENIDDKLARLMKIKKDKKNISDNSLSKKETPKNPKKIQENSKQFEDKKEESKLIDKSLSMSRTNQNFDDSSIENRSIYKIKAKKRKLELLKKRQENYLKLVAIQRKRREEEMKSIQEKIAIQNRKLAKIQDGFTISDTESLGDEYNSKYRVENGLAILRFVVKNNIAMKMLEFMNKLGFFDNFKNFQSLRDITIHGNKKKR